MSAAHTKPCLQILTSAWQDVSPPDLRALAGRLLEDGEESPSLIELFSLSPDVAPWEGPALFARALEELAAQDLDDDPEPEVTAQWASEMGFDYLLARRASPEMRELAANFQAELSAAFPELADNFEPASFAHRCMLRPPA